MNYCSLEVNRQEDRQLHKIYKSMGHYRKETITYNTTNTQSQIYMHALYIKFVWLRLLCIIFTIMLTLYRQYCSVCLASNHKWHQCHSQWPRVLMVLQAGIRLLNVLTFLCFHSLLFFHSLHFHSLFRIQLPHVH